LVSFGWSEKRREKQVPATGTRGEGKRKKWEGKTQEKGFLQKKIVTRGAEGGGGDPRWEEVKERSTEKKKIHNGGARRMNARRSKGVLRKTFF